MFSLLDMVNQTGGQSYTVRFQSDDSFMCS